MATVIVTGSGGLIGSESVKFFAETGYEVIGIENDMRARFFGSDASTQRTTDLLTRLYPAFRSEAIDIRDEDGVDRIFARHARDLELVIHAAAQPSHDWSAVEPRTDFQINAAGTLNLLEAARRHTADATFIFMSTNKVYGDRPNDLPLAELDDRLDLRRDHRYFRGIDTSMALDRSMHSPFGVSKAAADLMVQEYGRYFELPTVCFRGGCLTGPNHAGAELHGFLSYLMRCAVTGKPYSIYGYAGKQVRDNIHSADLVSAFAEFHRAPGAAAVYNIGGGRANSCSILEAIAICERITGDQMACEYVDTPRRGDHRWWITDLEPFRRDYPLWSLEHDLEATLQAIHDSNAEFWEGDDEARKSTKPRRAREKSLRGTKRTQAKRPRRISRRG
ncbi:MAG TPA: NAD-dependent epimerase/dehydratase family protein [Gaiellaceae bacterium]|jgi:CDP-paratose 2-epimerase